eukprot:g7895.t1
MRSSNVLTSSAHDTDKLPSRPISERDSLLGAENVWSNPLAVIVELLATQLENKDRWFNEGQSLRLVNKSWSSSVDILTHKLSLQLTPNIGLVELEHSLSKFPFLEQLTLNEDHPVCNLYGKKLSILLQFKNLRSLEIKNANLRGKALRVLCTKTTLRRLVFAWTGFDEKSLMRLNRLSNLTELELQSLDGISKSEEFAFLSELHQLESLVISRNDILKRTNVMSNIGRCLGLQRLTLDRYEVIPEHEIGFLAALTGLKSLRLYCREIKSLGSLDFVSQCPGLVELELLEVDTKLIEDWIHSMTQLRKLSLSCARIGETFNLPQRVESVIPNLTSLTLYDFTVPSPQLEALIKLGSNLSALSLGSLTLESSLSFSSLQKLTSFSCNYNRHLESQFLLELSQLQSLRSLIVGHLKGIVIDQLFTLVTQSLPCLTSLGILDITFTDSRVLALSKAPSLRQLTLIQCLSLNVIPFTCLEALGALASLVHLDIACDLGAEFWKEFLKLEFLTRLHHLGMKISEVMDPVFLTRFSNKAPTVKVHTSDYWMSSLFNSTLEVFKR